MTLPKAEGKLKPFPFEFRLQGNIQSKEVAYRPLQLNTLKSEHTHTHTHIYRHTQYTRHRYALKHLVIHPCTHIHGALVYQNDYMHYGRGIKMIEIKKMVNFSVVMM